MCCSKRQIQMMFFVSNIWSTLGDFLNTAAVANKPNEMVNFDLHATVYPMGSKYPSVKRSDCVTRSVNSTVSSVLSGSGSALEGHACWDFSDVCYCCG